MLALVLKDIAYHAAVAMDKVVYLVQLCLYCFRSLGDCFFAFLIKLFEIALSSPF